MQRKLKEALKQKANQHTFSEQFDIQDYKKPRTWRIKPIIATTFATLIIAVMLLSNSNLFEHETSGEWEISKDEAVNIAEQHVKVMGDQVDEWISIEARDTFHNQNFKERDHWYLQAKLEDSSYYITAIDAQTGDQFYGWSGSKNIYESIFIQSKSTDKITLEAYHNYLDINNNENIDKIINIINDAEFLGFEDYEPSGVKVTLTIYQEPDLYRFEIYPDDPNINIKDLNRNLYFYAPDLNEFLLENYKFQELDQPLSLKRAEDLIRSTFNNIENILDRKEHTTEELNGYPQTFYKFTVLLEQNKEENYYVNAHTGDIYFDESVPISFPE